MAMKVYLIKTCKIILFFLLIFCIQCKTIEVQYKKGNINEAIMNSIKDFKYNHKSLIKSENVYYIGNKSYNDYYRITISNTESKHLYNPNIKPNENKFPSNFYEENNILFIWYDENKEIDEKTIQTYLRYGLLVDNQNETIVFLDDIIDDSLKGVIYYICKDDLSNFKKIKSNQLKDSHPRLNCN
jgi:hypothetical protein